MPEILYVHGETCVYINRRRWGEIKFLEKLREISGEIYIGFNISCATYGAMISQSIQDIFAMFTVFPFV